ncbi:MAG: spermidine/putrescine ABC transporter permease [Bdellovibrionales bacterium GWA2_49_15]|nr:MAG: spermidine/putrescine ABC transporter permease [Bdellovibrionales bacterium GWA2_49_15]HAZ11465.1 ABC transporter permease [Bdellovibrionales bacterium]
MREMSILGLPALAWFVFFLLAPILIVILLSFLKRGTYGGLEWTFQLSNYPRIFEAVYFKIFFESFKLSLITAGMCFALGYPMAWAMATAQRSTRSLLILTMAIPFLTNLIIRVYALRIFLGMDGPVQTVLQFLGVEFDPFLFSQNKTLVLYGMVTTYLPFMVFPLHAALEKFDFTLVEAAKDLGASEWQVLTRVILPNTRLAIANGITLVFVPCLGEFVIPDLLGGAKSMLIGNLITEQFLKTRDWPFGAALSTLLILLLVLIPFTIRRTIVGRRRG